MAAHGEEAASPDKINQKSRGYQAMRSESAGLMGILAFFRGWIMGIMCNFESDFPGGISRSVIRNL
jgi:hypothetical protein